MRYTTSLITVAACLLASNALADSVIGWNPKGFPNGAHSPDPWDQTIASGSIILAQKLDLVAGLTRGSNVRISGTADAWGGSGFDAPDKNSAVVRGAHFSFAVKSKPGYALSLSSLQSCMYRGANSAKFYIWQYRIGDSGEFFDIGTPISFHSPDNATQTQPEIALGDIPSLQNVTETVTLRMVGWGAATKSASWSFGKSTGSPVLTLEGSISEVR